MSFHFLALSLFLFSVFPLTPTFSLYQPWIAIEFLTNPFWTVWSQDSEHWEHFFIMGSFSNTNLALWNLIPKPLYVACIDILSNHSLLSLRKLLPALLRMLKEEIMFVSSSKHVPVQLPNSYKHNFLTHKNFYSPLWPLFQDSASLFFLPFFFFYHCSIQSICI